MTECAEPAQPVAAVAYRMQQGLAGEIGSTRRGFHNSGAHTGVSTSSNRWLTLAPLIAGRPPLANTMAASNGSALKSTPCATDAVTSTTSSSRSFCRRMTRGSTQRIAQVGHFTRSGPDCAAPRLADLRERLLQRRTSNAP